MSDEYIYNPLNAYNYVPTDIYSRSGETPPPVTEYLSTSGGTMKGPINMNSHPVQNVPDPAQMSDGVNKKYTDAGDKTNTDALELFKEQIAEELAILKGSIQYGGTYDASVNQLTSVTPAGAAFLTVGSALPTASATSEGVFVIVSKDGTGTAPAPIIALFSGDWLISTGTAWTRIIRNGVIQTAANVSSIPAGSLASTNVQAALNELDVEKFPFTGGELQGPITAPSLTVTGSASVGGSLTVGTPGIVIKDGTGADFGHTVIEVPTGSQLVINGGFTVNGTTFTDPIPASHVSYDNTGSSLTVDNVQDGLFSLALRCDAFATQIPGIQGDLSGLETGFTDLTGRVTTLETEVADVRVDVDQLDLTTASIMTAVGVQTAALETIRTTYLPLTGGNISGSLQISRDLVVSDNITVGKDTDLFTISKPDGNILNVTGPVDGTLISGVPICYATAPTDPLVTKKYVDDRDAALDVRISYLEGNVIFMGTYDASVNKIEDVSPLGVGTYTPGSPLPASSIPNERNYFIVTKSGTGTGEAPTVPLDSGDWVLSTGTSWKEVDLNDQTSLSINGGTMQGTLNMNDNVLTGVKMPTGNSDASNKLYVDDQIGEVSAAIEAFSQTVSEFLGTYDASTSKISAISDHGATIGLSVGSALPAASEPFTGLYFRVSVAGTATPPAPGGSLPVNSWVYCTGTSWISYTMTGGGSGSIDASAVTYTGAGFPDDHNVAAALNTTGTSLSGLSTNQEELKDSAAICWGTFDLATAKITKATPEAIKAGFNVGSGIPPTALAERGYLLVAQDGTGSGATIPAVAMKKNDWLYSDGGASWLYYPLTGSAVSGPVDASVVTYTGTGFPDDHNVADALDAAGTAITGVSEEQDDLKTSAAICLGTFDLATAKITKATPEAVKAGFTVGSAIPAPSLAERGYFLVAEDGTGTGPGVPSIAMKKNDWLYSSGDIVWLYYPMTGSSGGGGGDYLPLTGGTLSGDLVVGTNSKQKTTVVANRITVNYQREGSTDSSKVEVDGNQGLVASKLEGSTLVQEAIVTGTYLKIQDYKSGSYNASIRLGQGYITMEDVGGRRFILKSREFGCAYYHHQVSYNPAPTPYPEPFLGMGNLSIYLAAISEVPNLSDNSASFSTNGWFRWTNVSLAMRFPVTSTGKTFPVGCSNFIDYDPFKTGLGSTGSLIYQSYKDFLNSTASPYYYGTFAKVIASGTHTGQTTPFKIIGELKVFNMVADTSFVLGKLYTFPPAVPGKYGVTIGLLTETAVTLPQGTYQALITLPDSSQLLNS